MKSALWILGGLCAGTGFLFLIGAFGDGAFGLIGSQGDAVPAAVAYSSFGYDASMDLQLTTNGMMAFLLLFSGLGMMIKANATAWIDSGGEY